MTASNGALVQLGLCDAGRRADELRGRSGGQELSAEDEKAILGSSSITLAVHCGKDATKWSARCRKPSLGSRRTGPLPVLCTILVRP